MTWSRPARQAGTARCGRSPRIAGDHPGARAARPDLDEEADAVVVGALDDGREVDPVDGLGDDRLGGRLAVGHVGTAPGRRCRTGCRGAGWSPGGAGRGRRPRPGGRPRNGPCSPRQREEPDAQVGHEALHGLALAADDRLARRVDDQQVDARPPRKAARTASAGRGRRRRPSRPARPSSSPQARRAASQGPARSVRNRGDASMPSEHLVAFGPGPQREQARRFAEAVADHRVRGDAEAPESGRRRTPPARPGPGSARGGRRTRRAGRRSRTSPGRTGCAGRRSPRPAPGGPPASAPTGRAPSRRTGCPSRGRRRPGPRRGPMGREARNSRSSGRLRGVGVTSPAASLRRASTTRSRSSTMLARDHGHAESLAGIAGSLPPPAPGQALDVPGRDLSGEGFQFVQPAEEARRRRPPRCAKRATVARRGAGPLEARTGGAEPSYASRTTWRQFPSTPSVLTPARRGPATRSRSQNCGPRGTKNGDVPAASSGRGLAPAPERREHLLVQAQRRLDQRGQARRRAGVADVPLDGAEGARRTLGPAAAELRQRRGLAPRPRRDGRCRGLRGSRCSPARRRPRHTRGGARPDRSPGRGREAPPRRRRRRRRRAPPRRSGRRRGPRPRAASGPRPPRRRRGPCRRPPRRTAGPLPMRKRDGSDGSTGRRGSPARSTAPTIASSSSPSPEQPHRDVEGPSPRGLLAGDGEARAADAELARDPAGDEPAEGPHRPVGRQGGAGRIPQRLRPPGELVVRQAEAELSIPLAWPRLERPAEVEVRRVQVQADPDEDAGPQPRAVVPAGIGDRLGRDAAASATAAAASPRAPWAGSGTGPAGAATSSR